MSGDNVVYAFVPKNETVDEPTPPIAAPKGFGTRHIQTLVLFICLTVSYTIRSQLSVSMVAMTSHHLGDHNRGHVGNAIGFNTTVNLTDKEVGGTNLSGYENSSKLNVYRKYEWDKPTQEMILFSFFVGYTLMTMPMGCLAQRFGGKKPIMVALAVNGVISIVTPWVPIFGGWLAVSVCRFLQGATQAAFFPSIHTMLGKWAPLSERGRLSTYIYTGSQFGTVVIFQLAGVFAGSPSLGWPATFWLCGVLSLCSLALIWWLGAATPHDHPAISAEEMKFILEGGSADAVPKNRRTPWKSILTSTAVWGLVISNAGSLTGYHLVLTQIPTYMNFILGVEITKNGLLSSLPYIANYGVALLSGYLADYAANKKIFSVANIRRIANTIGMAIAGFGLIWFSYISSTVPAIIMLMLSIGLHSTVHVGFHINHIDLAPNFAGPIMGLGNMVANLTSLLVPVIVSNIVKDDMRNQSRWQTVFLICALWQVATNVVFVIFVKGTVQPWNFYGDQSESDLEDKNSNSDEENTYLEEDEVITKTT